MYSKSFSIKFNKKIKPYKKSIKVDSDKSLSIRSFLIGSICQNISVAKNVLESDDVKSTINCLRKLGIKIIRTNIGHYKIFGKGLGSYFAEKNITLNFGNSGTLARLLIGVLSTTPDINVNLIGDKSLNKRSMKKLIDLMSLFGAEFFPKNKFTFPLKIISTEMPVGINYNSGVSAQLKSAVILAGLNSYGTTTIKEVYNSRDHTENMLNNNSRVIKIKKKGKKLIKIFGKKTLNPININVPGDPSSAAFFSALTILNKDSSLKINNVGLNPTRIGFYELLKKHGAKIRFVNVKKINQEKVGDIIIKSGKLKKPLTASKSFYEKTTDEFPILFCIAALTNGVSIFNGIKDLANKESNRITEMQKILKQIGIKSLAKKNSLKIYGKSIIKNKKGITVPNLGDHRICMSASILALVTGIKTNIKNFETVYTSSPNFLKIIKLLGASFEKNK